MLLPAQQRPITEPLVGRNGQHQPRCSVVVWEGRSLGWSSRWRSRHHRLPAAFQMAGSSLNPLSCCLATAPHSLGQLPSGPMNPQELGRRRLEPTPTCWSLWLAGESARAWSPHLLNLEWLHLGTPVANGSAERCPVPTLDSAHLGNHSPTFCEQESPCQQPTKGGFGGGPRLDRNGHLIAGKRWTWMGLRYCSLWSLTEPRLTGRFFPGGRSEQRPTCLSHCRAGLAAEYWLPKTSRSSSLESVSVTWCGRRDFAGMIKLRIVRWEMQEATVWLCPSHPRTGGLGREARARIRVFIFE